jgi:plastocyanin
MKRLLLLATAVLGAAVAASVAFASDQTITATPPNQFANTSVTIDQGDKVTFANHDTVAHDVTASKAGSDGKPLYASETTAGGASKPVNGVEYLTTGDYDFICSIHPNMKGTLHVTSAGTPAQRPGSGTGTTTTPPPPPPPGGGADTTKPTVSLKLLDTRLSTVKRRGALRVRVTSSEAATVTLGARSGKKSIGSGKGSVGTAAKTVSVKLNAAGRRAVRRAKHLRVAISAKASDAAGNAGSASLSKRI